MVKAKRRVLSLPISIPSVGVAEFVLYMAVAVAMATTLVFMGMKNLKMSYENRWLSERIERMRVEISRLENEIHERMSEFDVLRVDGKP